MKHFGLMFIMIFIFTACGQAPIPSPTPDQNATVAALSATMMTATLAAQPTATIVPTSTSLPSETPTQAPTETATPDLSPTETPAPTLTAEPSVTPWTGVFEPGNSDGLPQGLLRIENLTGVNEITITLNGITLSRDQPVYYAYKVNRALNIYVKWANYTYSIQVPGKKTYTGKLGIANKDKTTISIYLQKLVITGP